MGRPGYEARSWNELRQIHLIIGAPYSVNPSGITCLVCVYTWGFMSFLLILRVFTLYNETFIDHSHIL